jgi:hypothetical protein
MIVLLPPTQLIRMLGAFYANAPWLSKCEQIGVRRPLAAFRAIQLQM